MAEGSNEEHVPHDCVVYRLIKADWIKETDQGERPSSQAFTNTKEDARMSVYLKDAMDKEGKTIEDLLKERPGYRACWVFASELRKLGQEITRDDQPDFPGHALVEHLGVRNRSQSVKTKLSEKARWCC
jgi:hypothetical protein